MGKKIYLVAEVDTNKDSIIESTIRVFSSRNKQIEYVNELKETFGYKSGMRCISTKTLCVL